MNSSPKTEALAFRIWAFCEPREWNVTIPEIAEALDESPHRISTIAQHRNWLQRLRAPVGKSFNYDGVGRVFHWDVTNGLDFL